MFEKQERYKAFYDEPKCFGSFMAHYGKFENVKNYIAIVGSKKDQEKAGYYGEKIVLKCQELGKAEKTMVDKKYYEKLGGFSYLFRELRKKIGRQQTDVLINDAVNLCNELCDRYKNLPQKEKIHTERMIFPRAAIYLQMIKYIPQEEAIRLIEESV